MTKPGPHHRDIRSTKNVMLASAPQAFASHLNSVFSSDADLGGKQPGREGGPLPFGMSPESHPPTVWQGRRRPVCAGKHLSPEKRQKSARFVYITRHLQTLITLTGPVATERNRALRCCLNRELAPGKRLPRAIVTSDSGCTDILPQPGKNLAMADCKVDQLMLSMDRICPTQFPHHHRVL